jgi:hypothetical protein
LKQYENCADDSDFLQKLIDEGKPLPMGNFVIKKPLHLGGGGWIVMGATTAEKGDVSKGILGRSNK